MRQLALRGDPYSASERGALLAYCESDVDALTRLLPVMLPRIDLPRALLRGRYMAAVARMEWQGVPVDVPTLESLRENWDAIKGRLVERVDASYGVYVPTGVNLDSRWDGSPVPTSTPGLRAVASTSGRASYRWNRRGCLTSRWPTPRRPPWWPTTKHRRASALQGVACPRMPSHRRSASRDGNDSESRVSRIGAWCVTEVDFA